MVLIKGSVRCSPPPPPQWEDKTSLAKAECLLFTCGRSAGPRPKPQPGRMCPACPVCKGGVVRPS